MKKLINYIVLPFLILTITSFLTSCSPNENNHRVTRELVEAAVNERIDSITNRNEIRITQRWVTPTLITNRELRFRDVTPNIDFNLRLEGFGVPLTSTRYLIHDDQAWQQDSNGGVHSNGWGSTPVDGVNMLINQFIRGGMVCITSSLNFIIDNFNDFSVSSYPAYYTLNMTDILETQTRVIFRILENNNENDIQLELVGFRQEMAPNMYFNTQFPISLGSVPPLPPELR